MQNREPKMTYVQVAVGIIARDGQVLVTRRVAGDRFEGLWEFPGGKLLPEESASECLHRELEEELGVGVNILARLAPIPHDYGDLKVTLHPFVAAISSGEPMARASHEMRWVPADEVRDLPFPEANRTLLDSIESVLRSLSLL
jgi:8-oxo-dGTP diphosphatase